MVQGRFSHNEVEGGATSGKTILLQAIKFEWEMEGREEEMR
jgi:hypothetical protein